MYPAAASRLPAFAFLSRPLCESALSEPQQTFGGRYLHRTIYDKAAALFRSLIKNHAFVDGNKRVALSSLVVFLLLNAYLFYAPEEEAVSFALKVARTHGSPDLGEISKWIRKHSVSMERASGMTNAELRAVIGIVRPSMPWATKALALLDAHHR